MIEVEIDNWGGCYTGTCFTVSLNVLPSLGEAMRIHRDCFSKEMLEDQESFPIRFDDDDLSENTVVSIIEHIVTPQKHTARICIDIDGE